MLGLVVVAPALVAAFIVLFCIIVAGAYMFLIAPVLEWLTRKDGGFFKRIVFWPLRKAAAKVQEFAREQIAALKRYAVANQQPLVKLLYLNAEIVQRFGGTLVDMSEQIYEALWTLNHETVPRKIEAALVPLRTIVSNHTGRLAGLEDLNRRTAVEVGSALRALPWGVAGTYVGNWNQFFDSYRHLWSQVFGSIALRLNNLYDTVIPQIQQRLEALERGGGGVGQGGLNAIRSRLDQLESWRTGVVMPRLDALSSAVDALAATIAGEIEGGFTAMLERIAELERQVVTTIPAALDLLTEQLEQLRTELEQGVETGLEAFRQRLEALETAVFETVTARLDALDLALEALAAEVFEEVGAGLGVLTARIVELERLATVTIPAQIDLVRTEIADLRTYIDTTVLPRIAQIEALLEPAALGVAVLAALRIAAPNLFCRNVTRTTQALCQADEGWLDDLLALGLPILVLADLCDLMRAFQQAAGFAIDILSPLVLGAGRALECGGAGAAGGLPLNTTTLPTPSAALAL